MSIMRRLFRSLLVVGVLACFASPLFATVSNSEPAQATAQPAVAVQRVSLPDTGVRDEAAMVLVGTMLIGLAAVVRRAA